MIIIEFDWLFDSSCLFDWFFDDYLTSNNYELCYHYWMIVWLIWWLFDWSLIDYLMIIRWLFVLNYCGYLMIIWWLFFQAQLLWLFWWLFVHNYLWLFDDYLISTPAAGSLRTALWHRVEMAACPRGHIASYILRDGNFHSGLRPGQGLRPRLWRSASCCRSNSSSPTTVTSWSLPTSHHHQPDSRKFRDWCHP